MVWEKDQTSGKCNFVYKDLFYEPEVCLTHDTDAFKKGKPSYLELDDLAGQIGKVWKRLGIRLGIPDDVLDDITANAEDKPLEMLLCWTNTTTSATPYHDLYNALCHSRVGLNNLAKEFCYTGAFKKGKPSDRELNDLTGQIGKVWKRLGIPLGIPHDVLDDITANAEDKPLEMLLRWRNTTTSATPYHELYDALCHPRVGLDNLAKEFCHIPAGKRELPCSSNHPDAKRPRFAANSLEISIDCETVKAKGLNRTSDSTNLAQCKEGTEGAVPTEDDTRSAEKFLLRIAQDYYHSVKPSDRKGFDDFLKYLTRMRGVLIQDVKSGSLVITVKCASLQVLEELWADYTCGHLNEVVQKCLVTEDILTDLGLAELKLKTTIREDDYEECKQFFQELGWFKNIRLSS
ncbi:uncharacterized protein LOC110040292 [Orbicella faveolata]|uniref:uncharacterized protein LOC110040292 n=1 Tax=Orbicella faveolata TaxID=48498 RepID=UPI0009E62B76|nr:uncharacterized protein LOC110040292 [Orbicella faveolata]